MTPQLSRRRLLLGLGATGLLAGCQAPDAATTSTAGPRTHGAHQAGVVSPGLAQRHCDFSVWDAPGADWRTLLRSLGERITELTSASPGALAGLPPEDLTITVGIGPQVVAGINPHLPGATDLPRFAGEQIRPEHRGGDLMLQVCAGDPMVVSLAVTELLRDRALRPRWRQTAFRGMSRPDGAARNIFGFTDGIVIPRGEKELNEDVWLDSGATIAVIRRLRMDVSGFLSLPLARQEAVMGRRRGSSEPLSGGGPEADADLTAKSADGEYLIPADSHVRRAHPLTSGSGLMLRRSYSYDDGPTDRGLLFVCFQRDLRTFVATQHRLDEGDALMRYATATASGTFLVLPGFTPDRPLGSFLFR